MEKFKVYWKALIILILVLAFLIPITLIKGLIDERVYYQNEAITEVSSQWGNQQTIAGPIVTIPYIEYYRDTSKVLHKQTMYAHFLPDSLKINGELITEKRNRGIYQIVLYTSTIKMQGQFNNLNNIDVASFKENALFNEAFLSVGISDLRGIEEQIDLKWNNQAVSFNSGIVTSDVLSSGISAVIPLQMNVDSATSYHFSFEMVLKGSQSIQFVPVGRITQTNVYSKWENPKFSGSFLPDTRQVGTNGFTADWKILHLNRNYPQNWIGSAHNIYESSYGVDLLLSIDHYQKTERAVKYSFILISLTFLLLFFIELLNGIMVHPFQYILIGIALCIFYTLLLSISEHINFNISYTISGILTIALITYYVKFIVKIPKLYLIISAILVLLYGFIFTILQLKDYALLIGSIGLFVTLALVMYYSRKIDWYSIGRNFNGLTKNEN